MSAYRKVHIEVLVYGDDVPSDQDVMLAIYDALGNNEVELQGPGDYVLVDMRVDE